jgi:hypothetical protein
MGDGSASPVAGNRYVSLVHPMGVKADVPDMEIKQKQEPDNRLEGVSWFENNEA